LKRRSGWRIESAVPSAVGRPKMPGFIETCDPSHGSPPRGDSWAHEVKWDGYRGQAHLKDGKVKIFTRRGNDWSKTFHPIAQALSRLKAESAILDGEVVALKNSLSDFHELRRQLGAVEPDIIYQAFDLLWLNGEDLRPLPYLVRKSRLRTLIGRGGTHLQYVDFFQVDGKRMWRGACELKLEGIVSKRLDAPYTSGRVHTWIKAKCQASETFSVVGFSQDDMDRIDVLYLGREEDGKLSYAGKVETGLTGPDFKELTRRLRPMIVPRSPLAGVPRKPRTKWVEPKMLVEVAYSNKSADGRLRHPSFKGLRDDLADR
jgi:bifunctional non-homologous end joining protein LigD